MIAIASYIYLSVGGIVGAIMFSIGLLTILNMQFKLFTGSVGYIKSKNDIKDNLIILSGNIIGACGILAFRTQQLYLWSLLRLQFRYIQFS